MTRLSVSLPVFAAQIRMFIRSSIRTMVGSIAQEWPCSRFRMTCRANASTRPSSATPLTAVQRQPPPRPGGAPCHAGRDVSGSGSCCVSTVHERQLRMATSGLAGEAVGSADVNREERQMCIQEEIWQQCHLTREENWRKMLDRTMDWATMVESSYGCSYANPVSGSCGSTCHGKLPPDHLGSSPPHRHSGSSRGTRWGWSLHLSARPTKLLPSPRACSVSAGRLCGTVCSTPTADPPRLSATATLRRCGRYLDGVSDLSATRPPGPTRRLLISDVRASTREAPGAESG